MNCKFRISWKDPSVEDRALSEFRDILLGFWTSYDNIDADMQNDICKAFYKKLPKNNKFTDNFMAKTKRVVAPGIPGLRAVPDLVTIHPILPPTVHIQPYYD